MKKFRKILIANRGEIALRVMRTCRKLGIKTVAIYSEADRNSRHVRMADEAFCVGPGPSAQSYLRADEIIRICLENEVDAIHPGYGFLSENAGFARKLEQNNITLIGPSPESMEVMGSKLASKEAVKNYNVPMVPGVNEAVEDAEEAMRIAKEVGFPILIKASAGGGGKGMRVVERPEDLESQMKMAISEAISSFGDGAVFIERFVQKPRHIEIQVLGDTHGNIVHLFERECSVQRRHQKLVEEAPSAVLTPELRKQMGEAAVNVAKACNYFGAGTVEFLVDGDLNFYFLEMNTRLQVEHPVTELITGLDLVEEQIRVAEGGKLSFSQDDLQINGHAIELRVCTEDPFNDFLPNIGRLETYNPPKGENIRVDDFVESGYEIPIYYDNMISKLIVWGESRFDAILKMRKAIAEYEITGLETTLPFGAFVMNHPAFIEGNFDTQFIKNYFTEDAIRTAEIDEQKAAALLAVHLLQNHSDVVLPVTERDSPWFENR
ncbi:MAG: acetyl-CoA carboxylase biotin carboxylase subunit [Bacteroidetes bacterium]|nr:acetyl-CoA carboxylase biotin carboxylase subunit [Bacteroidota bacterium]